MPANNGFLKTAVSLIVGIVVGYGLSLFLRDTEKAQQEEVRNDFSLSETRMGGYRYINPLLDCDDFNAEGEVPAALMRQVIESYINDAKGSGTATHISVYFRSLNNGAAFGIKSDERYAPASLLKVPYALMALKEAEKNPSFLQKKITFSQNKDDFAPNIVDTGLIVLGRSYTVEELVYKMIVHSDNEAKEILASLFPNEALDRMLAEIGIAIPAVVNDNEIMSVKEYATLFRVLYNATYLNKEMSEKALSILSNTVYKEGLVAGVPAGTVVAHKFGERGFAYSNMVQLHDCGIVYVGNNPYLLGVMTRGTDFQQLTKVISDISSIVYKNVSANY